MIFFPFATFQEHVIQSWPLGLPPQNIDVALMCLPLLCSPFVVLEFQMDHMMPFEPQHPNGPPFAPRI